MTDRTAERVCLNCGTDVSHRRWQSVRCMECQTFYRENRYSHVCEHCGRDFRTCTPKVQRFCSYQCRGISLRRPPVDRTCLVCGATYRSVTTETCSTACQQWARSHKGQKAATTCARCGVPITGQNRLVGYCGSSCASTAARARRLGRPLLVRHAICAGCGNDVPSSKPVGTRFCGYTCRAKMQEHRRRAKLRNAPSEHFDPLQIFLRDNWTCHLCGEAIDRSLRGRVPMMATLDHLIPVSHPDFPGHTRANVASAHWICNTRKNRYVGADDRRLFALYEHYYGRTDRVAAIQRALKVDVQALRDQIAASLLDTTARAQIDAVVGRIQSNIDALNAIDPVRADEGGEPAPPVV